MARLSANCPCWAIYPQGRRNRQASMASQSRADGDRFLALGLPRNALQVTGSIKFDIELDEPLRREAAALSASWQRQVILGSSTHPGEDEILLQAFRELRHSQPEALLLLVPRHPERFEDVYRLCSDAGFAVLRRSTGERLRADHDVLLGDTMGELRLLSGTAAVAVIGGSFIEHGGQNVLEAAAWGVPVVSGPHMFNFTEITDLLTAAGAMRKLKEPGQLAACLVELMADEPQRRRMGLAGAQVVADNRGALGRLREIIAGELAGA